jgi:diacylglycerol kinase family enzyme
MRVIALVNPASGTMSAADREAKVQALRAALAGAGLEAEVRPTPGPELERAALETATSPGVDAVVAAGGDGTVSAVAGALVKAGAPVPLGIIPAGTLNHFAKDLGLPLDPAAAAAVVAVGHVRAVDVGEVNGRVFVNNSSIGLYPQIVRQRDRIRERLGSGKWTAMAVACVSVFRRHPVVHVTIETGGRVRRCTTPFVFVGNNRYEIDLFALGARPALDRGELSVYFTTRTSRFALLTLAIRAAFGRLEQARDFESLTLKQFQIETNRRTLPVAHDGEVTRMDPPLRYRTLPKALRVLAPPPTELPTKDTKKHE